MSYYTTTEEHEIVVRTSSAFAEQGVSHALKLLEGKAAQKCFTHQIQDTFEVRITHGDPMSGVFEICAKATYAKIVTATQEAEPGAGITIKDCTIGESPTAPEGSNAADTNTEPPPMPHPAPWVPAPEPF